MPLRSSSVPEGAPEWPLPKIEVLPDGRVTLTRELPAGAGTITMGAKGIKRGSTGAHATILLFHNTTILEYDSLLVLRSADRTKLGNKAHERLGPVLGAIYPRWTLHHDLDLFCLRVDNADETLFEAQDVEGEERPLEFLLEPYIIRHGGAILFAPPGSGKSYLGMLMTVMVDAGIGTFWRVMEARKCLYVNLERSTESVMNRLARVNRALDLPIRRKLLMLNARGRTLGDVGNAIGRSIEKAGVQCVVVDSLSRAGIDLKEDREANGIMDLLNGYGVSWLTIGHPPRGDSTHVFGSQMFDGAADLTVQVLTERRNGVMGLGLKIQKANDIPVGNLEIVALEFDEGGLTKFRRTRDEEFPELAANKKPDLATEIVYVLRASRTLLTVKQIYDALEQDGVKSTPGSVKATLNAKKGEVFHFQAQRGGETLWGLVDQRRSGEGGVSRV